MSGGFSPLIFFAAFFSREFSSQFLLKKINLSAQATSTKKIGLIEINGLKELEIGTEGSYSSL
ncbi:MAG: hypothetical protein C0599_07980 [Salinivirgaceae bacterium]|nr:MAG: hypothetical protein C0599_07980 [Salinivirgaceae bacterium]